LADEVVAFVHQHTLVVLTAVSLNLLVARDALKGSVVGVVDSRHRVGLLFGWDNDCPQEFRKTLFYKKC